MPSSIGPISHGMLSRLKRRQPGPCGPCQVSRRFGRKAEEHCAARNWSRAKYMPVTTPRRQRLFGACFSERKWTSGRRMKRPNATTSRSTERFAALTPCWWNNGFRDMNTCYLSNDPTVWAIVQADVRTLAGARTTNVPARPLRPGLPYVRLTR